jgi:poly-gamma-glutamate synthesis protein (capsule biosynthesis protein)
MAPDDPKKWGKNFIDWGADIVAGNHPHWYQPVEWYQGKPIFYAMGNTIFDQEWSTETKRGFLAKIIIRNQKTSPENVTYFPIGIRDYGQAYLLEGKEKEDVLTFLNSK